MQILPYYTYDDGLNWKGQWELIGGIPYAMSPMPVPKHQRIANAVGGELYLSLKNCGNCKAYQAIDYKIADDTILQPDVLVVCGEIEKKFLDYPPELVVEILSPSTAIKDRHTKYQLYQQQLVKYYLVVSPDEERVEVCELVEKEYQLKQSASNFQYHFIFDHQCSVDINFSEIW